MKFLIVTFLLTSSLFAVAPVFPIAPENLSSINTVNIQNNIAQLSTTNFLYRMDQLGNVTVVWMISYPTLVIRNGIAIQDSITVVQAAYKPVSVPSPPPFVDNWVLPPDPRLQRPIPPVPSPAGTLSDTTSRVLAFDLEMDDMGNAVVVWLIQSRVNEDVIAVQTAYKPAGGNWQLPADPISDNLAQNPELIDVNTLPDLFIAGGHVVLGWSINTGIRRVLSTTEIERTPVAQAGYKAAFPIAASNTYGAVDMGYNVRTVSDANLISINAFPRVTPLGFLPKVVINNTIQELSVQTLTPRVAVDTAGNAVIAWQCSENLFTPETTRINPSNSFVQAIYKPAADLNFNPDNVANLSDTVPFRENTVSAATSPATQVSQYQGQPPPIVAPPPQVSIKDGNAVVIWAESDATANFLQTRQTIGGNFIQAAYNQGGTGWQVPNLIFR